MIINHDCTLVEVKEGDGIIEQRNTHRTHIHGCPKARAPLPNRGSFLALKDSSARNNNNNYSEAGMAWDGEYIGFVWVEAGSTVEIFA